MLSRGVRRGGAVGLALALAACATTAPEPAPVPVDVPATWTALPADAVTVPPDDAWWTRFADSTLDALVAEALAHNLDLAAAAAAVDAAVARARIAGAALSPQVTAGFDAARRQQVFVGLPIPTGGDGPLASTSSAYGASLAISWEADLWGRLRAGRDAARADAAAVGADRDAARLSIAAQTARVWFAVVEAERQVALAAATRDSRQRTAERIAARYASGLGPSLDLRLARTSAGETEAALAERRRLRDATVRQLEALLGRYPRGELAAAPDLPPPPATLPAGLPAELVARRPDLVAAERRLAAAGFRLDEAKKALYPRLTLTGSGGSASDELGDLLDADWSVWSLAAGLLQPVFQGGRLRAGVDLADADRRRLAADAAGRVLAAFREVETALAAEAHLRDQEAALVAATEQAVAAAELAERRYFAGLADVLTLLEAQRQAFALESRLAALRRRRLANRVDLHAALGGDAVAPTVPVPTDPSATSGSAAR